MRPTRSFLMLGCIGLMTLVSGALWGQSGPVGPRFGSRPMMQAGPSMFGFMGGKTVTGAPYSAEVTFEHTQTLADGNLIDQKNTAMVYRDGQGRTRLEETRPSGSGNPQQVIRITDPVARVSYVLDPAKKTARRFTLPQARTGTSRPNFRTGSNANVTSQDLGSNTVDGLLAQGTETVRTIPAGMMGNTAPIQITTTRWYSPELSVDVSTETNDPQHGKSTTLLTDISREEPTSSLFEVPSDYTIVNSGPAGRQRFAPSTPPQQ
jgi:hypothetical protein